MFPAILVQLQLAWLWRAEFPLPLCNRSSSCFVSSVTESLSLAIFLSTSASGLHDLALVALSSSLLTSSCSQCVLWQVSQRSLPLEVELSFRFLFVLFSLFVLLSLAAAATFSRALGVWPGGLAGRSPGEGDFLLPPCRGGEMEGSLGDAELELLEALAGGGFAEGDGDLDFLFLTAWPVITRSLLLTDLSPL